MNNAPHDKGCPPLMSDQRCATDYRPSCYVHSLIQQQNGLRGAHEMRQFLQHNASGLRQLNDQYYREKNDCGSCQFFHVDPNGHDRHWAAYKDWLKFNSVE